MKGPHLPSTILLYQSRPVPCPYLRGKTWITHLFLEYQFPGEGYETLLSFGFRRSGYIVYRNHCPGCSSCIPLRIPVHLFKPSSSMKKCLRRNRDVTIQEGGIDFDPEVFSLYRRYCTFKHEFEDINYQEEGFRNFLCCSPLETRTLQYRIRDRLVGVSWVDILPHSFSSVYFAFDPEETSRSLGTFSVLHELKLAAESGRSYYYLGFYVADSRKMSYKARFKPYELLLDGQWCRVSEEPCTIHP
ncbi:MAG: arginyltransferase [Spirochaetales bacterium]|nr:arginyltransferase [Spirochaetales bacterium]